MSSAAFFPDPDADRHHNRLGFTFLLALALHAAIILGITFEQELRTPRASRLDITLAQYRSEKAPERADFVAQENQEGSGTLDRKAQLTARETADFHDNVIRDISPQQQLAARPQSEHQQTAITTTGHARTQVVRPTSRDEAQRSELSESELTILQRSLEIASLQAKLDTQRQAYAARPRIRRLTSVATRRSEDALYLHTWRTRIEQVGNANYPEQARRQQIFGELRLMVALLPNGEVHEIRVLQSSGHKVLDEAAMRIVHLAAPYEPFPADMRRNVDVLEIIRTWRFHKDRLSSEG